MHAVDTAAQLWYWDINAAPNKIFPLICVNLINEKSLAWTRLGSDFSLDLECAESGSTTNVTIRFPTGVAVLIQSLSQKSAFDAVS